MRKKRLFFLYRCSVKALIYNSFSYYCHPVRLWQARSYYQDYLEGKLSRQALCDQRESVEASLKKVCEETEQTAVSPREVSVKMSWGRRIGAYPSSIDH
ncbi:MAG: hypothetical protein F6K47_02640 [Symploca sp. SIO2E6]|nr:hypothetical protein [Symploca sp. SIO2E6]